MSLGIFGGYPGSNVDYLTFRNGNVDDLPEKLEETSGDERIAQSWGHVALGTGDIQYVRFMGGGGYGDPIDRDPEAVLRDVELNLVTRKAARDIYGVVIDSGGAIDASGTDARRLEIRAERLGKPVPATAGTRADVPASGMRIGEYLQRAADGSTQCTWCGERFAGADADWKDRAAVHRVPLSRAGSHRPDDDEFVLIESACPGCGTLLETELAGSDAPPLHDRIESWPANPA
jgi:N-methylhydantoinase B